jgi:hypothetical protein
LRRYSPSFSRVTRRPACRPQSGAHPHSVPLSHNPVVTQAPKQRRSSNGNDTQAAPMHGSRVCAGVTDVVARDGGQSAPRTRSMRYTICNCSSQAWNAAAAAGSIVDSHHACSVVRPSSGRETAVPNMRPPGAPAP